MKTSLLACFAIASAVALLEPGRAEACGGCFVQQTERTVVTDHRMALSVSTEQTVLWDQIRYSGDPAEFAWVLPVREGAKVELSNDAFFTSLDASTQPVVFSPPTYGGGFGCGLTGCSSAASDASGSSAPGPGQVQIVSQSVVGPYETVTLRATDSNALRNWLKSHAYAIPPAIEPTIDQYVTEKFDFIALRLRPDCGERSMQPVRIITKGADPTLPLRMVAAGVGAKVGLTLYVISEGRWQAQNFPNAQIDESKLEWDRTQSKSNYESVTESLMAEHDGRTWVTEYAGKPELFAASDPRYSGRPTPGYAYAQRTGNGSTPGLADTYYGLCKSRFSNTAPAPSGSAPPSAQPFTPCRNGVDAGVVSPVDGGAADASQGPDAASDGGSPNDAGDNDGGDGGDGGENAEPDAGAPDASPPPAVDPGGPAVPPDPYGECLYLDDLDVALRGLHSRDVWVTRLRASLPANSLAADDLRLEAATSQTQVSNVHYARDYADTSSAGAGSRDACVSAPKRHTAFGTWALAAIGAIAGIAVLRRRRRR